MYFETLADDGIIDVARRVVGALSLDHFFNVQLVGDLVIEVNPRISTIVYQEDLNLPYLGLKRALGELDVQRSWRSMRAGCDRPVARCVSSTRSSGTNECRAVLRCR